MRVDLLYFADCPNWREAADRLGQALGAVGALHTEITFVPVETDDEARRLGFGGSPTFLIDGSDLFGAPVAGALSCRLYPTAGGMAGVPDLADLVDALRGRAGS